MPLAIDLFCGLGGWAEGFLAEGYDVIGFDIEQRPYPGRLVLQDVLTLHGSQFKNAAVIVASPPCQAYSYRAMPWKRAKALPPPDNTLFDACFRIQREACEAAGRYIPLVVENVRGAQPWVGRARWNFGSYYLWGDVPALMPFAFRIQKQYGRNFHFPDPPIEVRTDVKRPFYFIRPRVPYWNKQGKYDRKRTVIQLGLVSQTTMRQAKMLKEQHMAEINGRRTIALAQIPFAGLLDKYVAVGLPAVGTTTQAKYRSHIAAHIRPAFATMRMCDIDKLCITGWLQQKQHLTHEMLMSILKTLSAIFSWAEEMNMFEGVNPCRKVKVLGKKSERSKDLPTQSGLTRFLAAIPQTAVIDAEGARLLVITACVSGMRISEVLGLQVRDIDPIAETVRIERRWARGNVGPTKTKDSQRVRQIPGLAAALLAYKACGEHARNGDDYIFSGGVRGLPPDDRDLQEYVFRPAADRAGIYTPGFGMHRFRHVNISWRQEVGAHPVEAQKCAGHASLSTTWRYTQVDVERERGHVRAILERLNGHGLGTDSTEVLQ